MQNFSNIQAGLLPTGTVTEFGAIEASSLTAYKIEGRWVPFFKVHGHQAAASPLVVIG